MISRRRALGAAAATFAVGDLVRPFPAGEGARCRAPAAFKALIQADQAHWAPIVQQTGYVIEE